MKKTAKKTKNTDIISKKRIKIAVIILGMVVAVIFLMRADKEAKAAIWDAWFPVAGTTGPWSAVAMSSDGQYQTAGGAGQLYVSTDFGNTWVLKTPVAGRNFISIDVSNSGQYQAAIGWDVTNYNSIVYVSTNYGNSWQAKTPAVSWGASVVAISSDGQRISTIPNWISSGNGSVSTDGGNTWSPAGPSLSRAYWSGVDMSDNGQYQTFSTMFDFLDILGVSTPGHLWVSDDYGATWNQRGPDGSYSSIVMSSDGRYQTSPQSEWIFATAYPIYISSDYGATWTVAPGSPSKKGYSAVAMSADGRVQTVIANDGYDAGWTYVINPGQIYVSTDYGNNWTYKGTIANLNAVAVSDNGLLSTGVGGGSLGGTPIPIYLSGDVFDFSLSNSGNVSTVQGGSGTTTITATLVSGTSQQVNLNVSGVPAGASASFSLSQVSPTGSRILTIDSGTAGAGTYTITVTGTGGLVTRTTTFTLAINTLPSCTGAVPSNAGLCSGDDTGLVVDTPRTLVGSCGVPKCEYTCNSGYAFSGGVCVAIPSYSCTGAVPSNAGLCSGDDTGLSANTPRTLVGACTVPTKCEYTCSSGYIFSGGVCVAGPPGACGPAAGTPTSVAPSSGLCDQGTPSAVVDTGTQWMWTCAGSTTVTCYADISNPPGKWSDWSETSFFLTPPSYYPIVNIKIFPEKPSIGQTVTLVNNSTCFNGRAAAPCEAQRWESVSASGNQPTPRISTANTSTVVFNAVGTAYVYLMPTSVGGVCTATGQWMCALTTPGIEFNDPNYGLGQGPGGNRLTVTKVYIPLPTWKEIIPF